MKEKKTVIIIVVAVVVILLLCCCAIGGAMLLGLGPISITGIQEVEEPTDEYDYTEEGSEETGEDIPNPATEEAAEIAEEESGEAAEVAIGTITGTVSYPSEFIPDGMTICAEPDAGTDSFCTTDLIEQTAALPIYELEVPPGDYHVYAYDADGDPDYTAYYSEFVTCGLSVDCTSHDPILVTVTAGETVEDVDPGDWYNF